MNTFENQPQATNPLYITSEIKNYLIETSKWGKFLSILGYIGIGLMVIFGIASTTSMTLLSQTSMVPGMQYIGFIYLIFAVIYYFPTRFLHKFCVEINSAIASNNNQTLESAFGNLKSLFKFMGIITIVMISAYILIIIGMIVFFSSMAM